MPERVWSILEGEFQGVPVHFLKRNDLIVGWLGAEAGSTAFIVDALNAAEQREAEGRAHVYAPDFVQCGYCGRRYDTLAEFEATSCAPVCREASTPSWARDMEARVRALRE